MNPLSDTQTFTPDGLVSGDYPVQHQPVTVKSGRVLLRGTAIGLIMLGALTVGATTGTGNGVLTPTAAPLGKLAQVGDYVLTIVAAASDGGTFQLVAPDGSRLKDGAVGVAYAGDHLNFTLADGATDFTVGAKIVLTVAAGSKKAVKSLTASLDGSQRAVGILAEDVDATDEDVEGPMYVSGQFDPTFLLLTDTGHTAETLAADFGDKPIFLRAAI
jgi:hypothetical protein